MKTQEKVETATVTKPTSSKVSDPERARRGRSSSRGHSSSEDESKAASSSPGRRSTFDHRLKSHKTVAEVQVPLSDLLLKGSFSLEIFKNVFPFCVCFRF